MAVLCLKLLIRSARYAGLVAAVLTTTLVLTFIQLKVCMISTHVCNVTEHQPRCAIIAAPFVYPPASVSHNRCPICLPISLGVPLSLPHSSTHQPRCAIITAPLFYSPASVCHHRCPICLPTYLVLYFC